MPNMTITSLDLLRALLDGIIPKLIGSSREQSVGQDFCYSFWHEQNHAELDFYPWTCDNTAPRELDQLLRDINRICFKPMYYNGQVRIGSITHLLIERQYQDKHIISTLEETAFYERADQNFAIRWDLEKGKFMRLKPLITIDLPYYYENDSGSELTRIFPFTDDFLEEPYSNFDFKVLADVIRWGAVEFPRKINIAQTITALANLNRGICDFVAAVQNAS